MVIQKEISYAKEIGEVMVLVSKLTSTIVNKGDYMAVMPELIAAIDGISDIDDEFNSNKQVAIATIAYHAGELAGSFAK